MGNYCPEAFFDFYAYAFAYKGVILMELKNQTQKDFTKANVKKCVEAINEYDYREFLIDCYNDNHVKYQNKVKEDVTDVFKELIETNEKNE